ncbi:LOG family protein [Flagellimonas sp. HMM57]|uniref:LOG family protein n=1 Tax=unclassified Flagellimonas TaxID=2644544 RepID=UPI0013D8BE44|nr:MULTISPECIES: LOG family protein [unclassified Flagellimonas]UII77169.1 LOG family protein [Flagellimonas sp. HMM57]
MTKYATLFGGSGNNRNSKEYLETITIGKILSKNGFTVKNGGYGGMMEAISKGAAQSGGKTIGITCKQVGTSEGNPFLTETIVTDKLYQRLQLLIEDTEVFVVQKGGIGTLSEVFLTLDVLRKEASKKRIYFIGEVWESALESLKQLLIPEKEHELFHFVDNATSFENMLKLNHHA